jgi:hypothetical protein
VLLGGKQLLVFQARPSVAGWRASTFHRDRGTVCEFLRRKEVIQPQVPLRLPCYDFIPVTSYTLGPCLSCELAQALRVRPASMM